MQLTLVAAPDGDAGTKVNREVRPDASLFQIHAVENIPAVLRQQRVFVDSVVNLDRQSAAVSDRRRSPGPGVDVVAHTSPDRVTLILRDRDVVGSRERGERFLAQKQS